MKRGDKKLHTVAVSVTGVSAAVLAARTIAEVSAVIKNEDRPLARRLGLLSIGEMVEEDQTREREELRAMLIKALAYQRECEAKASQLIELVCAGPIDVDGVRQWLSANEVTEWVLIDLIHSGAKIGVAQKQRHVAAAKNAKERAWVLDTWQRRTDEGQSKASFSRMVVGLLKTEFPKFKISERTIETQWLKDL